jgi:hypothetical protein
VLIDIFRILYLVVSDSNIVRPLVGKKMIPQFISAHKFTVPSFIVIFDSLWQYVTCIPGLGTLINFIYTMFRLALIIAIACVILVLVIAFTLPWLPITYPLYRYRLRNTPLAKKSRDGTVHVPRHEQRRIIKSSFFLFLYLFALLIFFVMELVVGLIMLAIHICILVPLSPIIALTNDCLGTDANVASVGTTEPGFCSNYCRRVANIICLPYHLYVWRNGRGVQRGVRERPRQAPLGVPHPYDPPNNQPYHRNDHRANRLPPGTRLPPTLVRQYS